MRIPGFNAEASLQTLRVTGWHPTHTGVVGVIVPQSDPGTSDPCHEVRSCRVGDFWCTCTLICGGEVVGTWSCRSFGF